VLKEQEDSGSIDELMNGFMPLNMQDETVCRGVIRLSY